MDPVTHVCSGLLGGSYLRKKNDKKVYYIAAIGGLLPDIDNVIGFLNEPKLYLLYHRGVTHSIVGAVLFSFLAAVILKFLFFRNYNVFKITIIFYLLGLMHIFLDLVTSYGTQIALPFTNERFSLESVFIIDPFFTLALIVMFLVSIKINSAKLKAMFIAFVFIYPLTNYGVKAVYSDYLQSIFKDKSVTLTTAPFTPLNWKVILGDDKYLYYKTLRLFQKAEIEEFDKFVPLNKSDIESLLNEDDFLKVYKWFLKYPVVEQIADSSFKITDLRFMINLKNIRTKDRTPFAMILNTDSKKSRILSYKYDF
ncbi:MAG: inner membrane protein [Deferribacteres bacterium]|jgi:inner membrane protein|nr:inner membrane protein [Deferribacteres bacterium]